MASGDNEPEHVENLNDLAHRRNTYLQFNDDEIVDEEHHLEDDPRIIVTEELNDEFDLFDAYPVAGTDGATYETGDALSRPGRETASGD